jgi:hypothetical protein
MQVLLHAEEGGTMGHREMADFYDARARAYGIDPPRPGRKTYEERYAETLALSPEERRELLAEREANDQEAGVLHRVMADLGE